MMYEPLYKIQNKIDEFLAPFGCTCVFAHDFSYYYFTQEVAVSFLVCEKADRDFMHSIEMQRPKVNCDIFLWSLLHEIGHHETVELLSDFEMDLCQSIKRKIQEGEIPNEVYYICFDEVMATQWAVDFANENAESLFHFWNELQPLIMNFYTSLK